MAGTITRGNHPKALWPGIKDWFGAVYDQHEAEWSSLFDVQSSSQAYEEDVEHTSFGLAPQKPEGQSVIYDSHTQGYVARYQHVAYGLGYVVTREELADNLYQKVSMSRAQSLAFSMAQTRENVAANIYNRAFNSSYTGGDGKEMIATDHPSLAGDWSNELSTAAQLSEAAIETLAIQIMDAKNSRGLKISLKPTKLIVPTALYFEACRILESQLRSGTADNDVNALRLKGVIPTVEVNHYLTDANNWFIRTNAPSGLKWYDRESVSFDKDEDFDTDNAKAKGYMRFSAGWTDPRGIYGSAPA
jgi:phage major head subunit gpT-like protein